MLATVINLLLANIISPDLDLKTTLTFCVSPTLSVEENSYEMQAGYIVPVVTFFLLIIVIIGLLTLLTILHMSRNKQMNRLEDNIKSLEKEKQVLKSEKEELKKTKSKLEAKVKILEGTQL